MTTLKQSILDSAKELQQELDTLLEGMDYCLDWKQDDDEWSPRELLWHILEDPEVTIGALPGRDPTKKPAHQREGKNRRRHDQNDETGTLSHCSLDLSDGDTVMVANCA